MVIKIIYISKNTSMRCRASLRFTVTYHFGHRTCNSEPILLKIVSKDAHFLGVYYGMLNRSLSVRFEAVFIGFYFQKVRTATGPVRFKSVRFGPVSVFFRSIEPDLQTLCISRLYIMYDLWIRSEKGKPATTKWAQTKCKCFFFLRFLR